MNKIIIDYSETFSTLPKNDVRNRVIQDGIFVMTKNKPYEIPITFNVSFKKGDLLKEHVMGRKAAANKIIEFIDKNGGVTPDQLYNLIQRYCKYVRVPRNKNAKGKTINGALVKYQNSETPITYEIYKKVLLEVWGLTIVEGAKEFEKYMNNINKK